MIHTAQFGRTLKNGWLLLDDQRNMSGQTKGQLVKMNVYSNILIGGYDNMLDANLIPENYRFTHGFTGNIENFDLLNKNFRLLLVQFMLSFLDMYMNVMLFIFKVASLTLR